MTNSTTCDNPAVSASQLPKLGNSIQNPPSADAMKCAAEIKKELRDFYHVSVKDHIFEEIIDRHIEPLRGNLDSVLQRAVETDDLNTRLEDALKSAKDAIESYHDTYANTNGQLVCPLCGNWNSMFGQGAHKPDCKRQIALAQIKAVGI